ncbi:MAG TPA: VapC toxin family PIN domain ribonuclease [Gammaproteobacteria bacterium]|nr:VapC toxin family PIN domain ribonuclease [Gammaproteobacteria bacterium]
MKEFVTDTHALLWHLFKNERLSPKAANIFNQADNNEVRIDIPNIVLVEIVYLIEKFRIPSESINNLIKLLETKPINYQLVQIELSTIRAMESISRQLIPDMPDRIITATALELGLPLITKDQKITDAQVVEVIW